MTHAQVLLLLAPDPTERGLSGLAEDCKWDYTIFRHADGPDVIGYAIIRVDNGLLKIPYDAVTLGDGWEHFCLDQAQIMPEPPGYAQAVQALRAAEARMIALIFEFPSLHSDDPGK